MEQELTDVVLELARHRLGRNGLIVDEHAGQPLALLAHLALRGGQIGGSQQATLDEHLLDLLLDHVRQREDEISVLDTEQSPELSSDGGHDPRFPVHHAVGEVPRKAAVYRHQRGHRSPSFPAFSFQRRQSVA